MKWQTGKKKLNIWKWLAAGSAGLILLLTVAGALMLRFGQKEQEETLYAQEEALKIETKAVLSEEKAAERKFLNQPAPGAAEGDNRQVFRIIEVIPHEVCSVFPYFVDWKTEEEYDKYTPLGYDGIMLAAQFGKGGYGDSLQMFSTPDKIASESRPYTYVEEMYVKEYFEDLADYSYEFSKNTDVSRGGKWFRKTPNKDELIEEEYGYFEYVGEGKGLYYINTTLVAGVEYQPDAANNSGWWITPTSDDAISYEIQAVPRKGTENPKGYMFACDPAYYWSKESATDARPKYNGADVVGLTDYNYDLKFTIDDVSGTYIVKNAVYSAVSGSECDYELSVDESALTDWESGFYYKENGYYTVASCTQADDGKYIRFADASKDDGYTDANRTLDKGYFLMVEADEYPEVPRYKVSFKVPDEGVAGSYMAKAPQTYDGDNFSFIYQGEGKGSYRVSFLYAPKDVNDASDIAKRYSPEVTKVTTKQGSYALATTSTDGDGKAKYSDEEGVAGMAYDYAEVVLRIGAFTGFHDTQGIDSHYRRGVTVGEDYNGNECGGWVFVPLENASDMKQSFLKDVKQDAFGQNSNSNAYFTPGDRIYVTGQKRVYRFYCRDGMQNNEWFKLLCYSNNPEDEDKPYSEIINGVGYDFTKTAMDNLANDTTKQILNAFDSQYRIEIIQVEPQYLTSEMVKEADLIYLSNQEGINGMSQNWNNLDNNLLGEELPDCNFTTICPFTAEQDISSEVLMTLYDECIYEQNRALIVAYSVMQDSGGNNEWPITKNISKLYYMMNMFDDALSWAYFMPEQYPDVANELYTKIRTQGNSTTVDICPDPDSGRYNIVFPQEEEEEEEPDPEATPTPTPTNAPVPVYDLVQWYPEYFHVYAKEDTSRNNPLYPYQNNIWEWNNVVHEGETKLTVGFWLPNLLMDATTKDNIWQILRNRKLDTSMLVVEVTNAETTVEEVPRKVIYADEFAPDSFDVKYKVLLLGSSRYPSSLTGITLTFEDGSYAGSGSILQYGEENTNNVRHGFTVDGTSGGDLNPSRTVRKITITATDSNGKVGTAEVYVIVREAFQLN